MNDRIKAVREALRDRDGKKYTQTKLAEEMHVTRDMIATYEVGRVEPSPLFISTLCSQYGVNEEWLRTGEGEMFAPKDRLATISDITAEMFKSGEDDIRYQITKLLYELTPEEIKLLTERIKQIADNYKDSP